MSRLRTIERSALDGSLKLARVPVDTAIRFLPASVDAQADVARLVVDRAEVSVRLTAGKLLRDDSVLRDARTRAEAVKERRHAADLRAQAAQAGSAADERLAERESAAEQEHKEAAARAEQERKDAEAKRQERVEKADEVNEQRKQASHDATAKAEEAIHQQESQEKLRALKEKEAALAEKEEALTASDESQRLAGAAARAKAKRKDATDGDDSAPHVPKRDVR